MKLVPSNNTESLSQVPDDLRPLLPGFLERREREVPDLMKMLQAHDFVSIRNTAHKLKGNGAGYGFQSLTDLGSEMEQAALQKDAGTIEYLILRFAGIVTEIRKAM